jgi:predicted Zn-dependent peptidase
MASAPVLLVETVPGSATAAVGAWIRSGSAHEDAGAAGITHLLEHLLLRRCGKRTPEAIAELIDSLGGSIDAFTTREVCAVTAHVPLKRLPEAVGLVLDAIFEPRIRKAELELERGVVAAEFDLVQDSPGEVVAEEALAACWGQHPLARPVLGSRDVVGGLGVADLNRFHRERFHAGNLLMVAVGPPGFDPGLAELLAEVPQGLPQPPPTVPPWRNGVRITERAGLEQVYANLVLPGLPADDPEVYTLGVLHQLLGAGASSRLFRELRDRLGLVYEVSTSVYAAELAGVLEVTFSAPLRRAGECWRALGDVLEDVGEGRISAREVALAKQALQAAVVLGAEGADALMEAHAGEMLARHRRFDPTLVNQELEAIDRDRVRALARRLVRVADLAGAICGPHGGVEVPAWLAVQPAVPAAP